MEVYYACENCETEYHYSTDQHKLPEKTCSECGEIFEIHNDFNEDNILNHCMICGGNDFYKSKQINPTFGFSVIILGTLGFFLSVLVIPGMDGFLWGMVVLLSLAVIDRVLRMILPEAIICYRCSSVYHNVENDSEFGEFDHELATHLKFSDE